MSGNGFAGLIVSIIRIVTKLMTSGSDGSLRMYDYYI
jgi:hypothetical protein